VGEDRPLLFRGENDGAGVLRCWRKVSRIVIHLLGLEISDRGISIQMDEYHGSYTLPDFSVSGNRSCQLGRGGLLLD
jgi:hypothetical protein